MGGGGGGGGSRNVVRDGNGNDNGELGVLIGGECHFSGQANYS